MMRTLFLQAPSFDGFDGGAGSRYQARREIRSYWYRRLREGVEFFAFLHERRELAH